MAGANEAARRRYWKANNRLILVLLAIAAVVSYGCGIFFVEALNQIQFFGLPLGFWFAQQGAMYLFIVLIFFYAWRMDKLDHKYHTDE